MLKNLKTEIVTSPFDLQKIILAISKPEHGAIDTFIGAVRNNHQGRIVSGITYDLHPALCLKTLDKIGNDAFLKWPEINIYIGHYHGYLSVGGISIVIAVSSPHRHESFETCRHLIEEIKKTAPVWKNEHYSEGDSCWLPGTSLVNKSA